MRLIISLKQASSENKKPFSSAENGIFFFFFTRKGLIRCQVKARQDVLDNPTHRSECDYGVRVRNKSQWATHQSISTYTYSIHLERAVVEQSLFSPPPL